MLSHVFFSIIFFFSIDKQNKICIIRNSFGGDYMVKTNLPVILLKGAVLLPYCDFRLELNSDIDKHVLELAESRFTYTFNKSG